MSAPERRINTFYAFCSLLLPGLGQMLQKRVGTAVGFFTLFLLSGFLPGLIVSLLFRDRFVDQPFRVHLLHISVFGGLFFAFMLAVFWSVLDAAAWRPSDKPSEDKPKAKPYTTLFKIFAVIVIVGILVALLLPSIPAARTATDAVQQSDETNFLRLS